MLVEEFRRDNCDLNSLAGQSMLVTALQPGLATLRTPSCGHAGSQNPNCPVGWGGHALGDADIPHNLLLLLSFLLLVDLPRILLEAGAAAAARAAFALDRGLLRHWRADGRQEPAAHPAQRQCLQPECEDVLEKYVCVCVLG